MGGAGGGRFGQVKFEVLPDTQGNVEWVSQMCMNLELEGKSSGWSSVWESSVYSYLKPCYKAEISQGMSVGSWAHQH